MLSRLAGSNTHGQGSSYFLGWEEYEKNPYDEAKNPDGMIQMGLAENQLSFDLLESWIAENPDAAAFKRNGRSNFRELALFQDYHGLPEFKQAMCEFMSQMRGNRVTFDPKNLVLTAGATSANETVIFCIAGPGDAILLPTPYYPGFDRDLKWRTGAEIVPIECTSSNNFMITESAIVEAYESAKIRDLNVKAILVTNPSNPLGISLSREELTLLINFVSANDIHLISDEIYAGTVFNSSEFVSAVDLLPPKTTSNSYSHDGEVSRRVHVVSSLSKDLGLPGFRVGAIYSNDERIVSAATKMSSFGLVSSQTQYLLSVMLSDTKFMSKYVSENQRRLKKRYETIVSGLQESGINCLKGNAGLFCWVDMRHLLKSNTFDGEMDLWKKILYEVKLNISPGSSCHCVEPGWFRVCFANMSEDTLQLAMQRVKAFIPAISFSAAAAAGNNKATTHSCLKKSYHRRSLTKWVLRLSFDEREREPAEERCR